MNENKKWPKKNSNKRQKKKRAMRSNNDKLKQSGQENG